MTIHRPVDETNQMGLLDEVRLLRAENVRLKRDKDLLLTQLFDCLQALIRSERRQRT